MYGILRANKIKLSSVSKRFQKHIQRQSNYYHSNPDIDVSKLNEDVVLIFSKDFKKSIFEELEKHKITKQPRKNAVGLIDGVITASPCFFDKMDKNNAIDFFKKALPIIEKEYGPIISAAIHFDEKTPHLHFCSVPLIKNSEGNYKLSAKEVMGNRQKYIEKQDRFFDEYFKGYGLSRGQSVKETHRKHIEHNRYKAQKAQENFIKAVTAADSQKEINQNLLLQQAELEKKLSEEKEQYEKILFETSKALESCKKTLSQINCQKKEKSRLEGQIKALDDVYKKLQEELLEMASNSQMYRELLKRTILEGNYKDTEDLKQKIMESEEASQIWECMVDFYSEFTEENQGMEDGSLEL